MENEIKSAVLNAAIERNGRMFLACETAFEISKQFNVTKKDIGRICNESGIKIASCQLGCF